MKQHQNVAKGVRDSVQQWKYESVLINACVSTHSKINTIDLRTISLVRTSSLALTRQLFLRHLGFRQLRYHGRTQHICTVISGFFMRVCLRNSQKNLSIYLTHATLWSRRNERSSQWEHSLKSLIGHLYLLFFSVGTNPAFICNCFN